MSTSKKRPRSGESPEEAAASTPAASAIGSPKSTSVSSPAAHGAAKKAKQHQQGETSTAVGAPAPVGTPKLTRATSLTPASPSALMVGAHTALTAQAYSSSASGHAARFKGYTSQTAERAHQILHHVFPRKVLELDHLVGTSSSANSFQQSVTFPFDSEGHFLPGRETEPIASNPTVMALIPTVKDELLQMIDHLGALKLYIQLLIPKVDDGNNFGVEVSADCWARRGHPHAHALASIIS